MLAPGTRFAQPKTWTIDINEYGERFWHVFHVVSATPKSILVLSTGVYHGDIHVEGNVALNRLLQAHNAGTTLLNENTMPTRYYLKKAEDGTDYFVTGKGTASSRVRLNGSLMPVVYLRDDPRAACAPPSKKRSAASSAARTARPRLAA